jgi:ABC-type branched-subunit amino acid transport system substrate-binding protein
MMSRRKLTLCLLLFLLGPLSLWAQNRQFERGLELYRQEEFQEAARIFLNQADNPEAILFGGKSLYGSGAYLQALNVLKPLHAQKADDLRWEAQYTSALAYMQLKRFGSALELLQQVKQQAANQNIGLNASNTYDEILHYLTLPQRLAIFQSTPDALIRKDLVEAALTHTDTSETQSLIQAYRSSYYQPDDLTRENNYPELRYDSLTYPQLPLRVPNGMIHNVGVALPEFEQGSTEFQVTQSLYFGMLLAAEEFNRRNNDQKVFLRHHATNQGKQNLDALATDWIWNKGVDMMLGPLFSESAKTLSSFAEEYEIPLVAPLANSDSLNLDNPYVFQTNPTFTVRGREMAQYAVNRLKLDTLAVIVERNSLGAKAAYAFREEAEHLGAYVPYFFIDDFAEKGYDLSDYRDYFKSDSTLRDSLNIMDFQGVYAPFTGRAASTLVDLFLTDLEAGRSDVTILGSQEWNSSELSRDRRERFDIYYPTTFALDDSSDAVIQFKENYRARYDMEPTRFSYIGYNTADYVFSTLERSGNPGLLKKALKYQPRYKGLGNDIVFEGTHINHALIIRKMSAREEE